jgi:hypothetical protein
MMHDPLASIPAWIPKLAGAVSRLSSEQLMALASHYTTDESIGAPSTVQIQRNLSLATTDATYLARILGQIMAVSEVRGRDIAMALTTLAYVQSTIAAGEEKVEVVCTAPSGLGVPVRTTFATAIEMIQAARQAIFVVGYVFTEGARGLIVQCAGACQDRGIHVTLIGNRMQNQLAMLRSLWPADSPPPSIFTREADSADDMAALHAKLLICDGSTALVTSANFSYHGLHENIEVGVKIHSKAVTRLVDFIQAMIRLREVVALEWTS